MKKPSFRNFAAGLHRSPYWIWAMLCLAWQSSLFIGHRREIIKNTGVAYRSEDAIFVCIYYILLLWIAAAVFAATAEFLRKRWPGMVTKTFATFEIVFSILAWLEVRIYTTVGLHITDPIFIERIQEPSIRGELDLGARALREILINVAAQFAVVIVAGILAFKIYEFLNSDRSVVAYRRLRKLSFYVPSFLASIWILAYILGGWSAVPILEALPLYNLFNRPSSLVERNLIYPPQLEAPKLNGKTLMLVGIESFRADNWNAEKMPLTWGFFAKHAAQCQARTNHYAPSSVTEYGVFSLLYGVDGNMYRYFRKLRMPAFDLNLLKQGGYRIEGYVSGNLSWWSHSDFMFSAFDHFKEYQSNYRHVSGNKFIKQDKIVQESLSDVLTKQDHNKFVFGFFSSTHSNYSYPKDMEFNKPVVPLQFQGVQDTMSTSDFSARVKNRYYNSVRYADSLIYQILASAEGRLKKGDVEIVFTGDHGEELWDHGQFGHASPRFYSERIRVPLLWCGSLSKQIPEQTPTSHVDIMPTLVAAAGGDTTKFSSYFSGLDLNGPLLKDRKFIVNVGVGYPERTRKLSAIDHNQQTYWLTDYWYKFSLEQITTHAGQDLPLSEGLKLQWQGIEDQFRQKLNQFTP